MPKALPHELTNPTIPLKKERGRPSVITDEVLDKLETAFAFGCTDIEAALYADIGGRTLSEYFRNNPAFRRRTEELKETPILLARESVVKGLKNNPNLALAFLERKLKKEFSQRVEQTGADGKDLPTPILAIQQNVSTDNGDKENSGNEGQNPGSTGRDIGVEDDFDSLGADESGAVGQDSDPDERGVGVISALEARSNEGLQKDNDGASLLEGQPLE